MRDFADDHSSRVETSRLASKRKIGYRDDLAPHGHERAACAQHPPGHADPNLKKLLPDLPPPVLPVWLAMHRDVRTSMRIRRVADFLQEELKSYSAGAG